MKIKKNNKLIMKVIDTKFKGLKIVQQIKHGDNRGNLREIFRRNHKRTSKN